ncbi:haloacid dehalogenase family protein [Cryptosporidium muris RN66]|uniref:Haloacid dehalogenase family protein n=1 Tax=Cryptosporidium muris (strain RN66) TaxID=441375 RepID=B6AI98_CRYMR|nr:haloacid dehalogenase family protein [Cryptosporidium muris RN66]EEA07939.1 haloacid dehalogenase family protein [Cryptosporidium muris RN66]|eukprot:XP_002142288.1 haloacid dehalogenase family protein [Cryptosporidium muris RN66]
MNDIRCIITDIDGTLANEESKLSIECAMAFRSAEDAGFIIFPATGRCQRGLFGIYDDETNDIIKHKGYPGIYHNGALIIGPDGYEDIIEEICISRETCIEIIKRLKSLKLCEKLNDGTLIYRDLSIGIYERDFGIVERSTFTESVKYLNDKSNVITKVVDDLLEFAQSMEYLPQKILVIEQISKLGHLVEEIDLIGKALDVRVVLSSNVCIDILPTGVSKGHAAKILLERLGIKPENTMAIGDANNDLEILEYVGHPVAMGNAVPQVKEIARHIVATNDQHGFAEALYNIAKVPRPKISN